jgi:hypothetical protein
MNEFKFTPEPWVVDEEKTAIVNMCDYFKIEVIAIADKLPKGITISELEAEGDANAKLIASGPSMIKEIKYTHDLLLRIYSGIDNETFNKHNTLQSLRDRMAALLAIIDKATK